MSSKSILSNNFSCIRLSIFDNDISFNLAKTSSLQIDIGNPLINQCEIINNSGDVIPSVILKDEYIQLDLEIEGIPANTTSLYWQIDGISSPFSQVIDQITTTKTGINYIHLGGRIFSPDEWIDETTGFNFFLVNTGNQDINILRLRTEFKSYFSPLKL